jgi:hypothetical protein
MYRLITRSALILAIAVLGGPHGQAVGAPLQLSPGAATGPAPAVHAKIPNNWKLITNRPDPLTEKSSRYVVDMAKTKPVFHGQTITAALVVHCVTVFLNKPSEPELILLFTGLQGIGHINRLPTKYRWDEGRVHSFMLKGTGKTGKRAIALAKLISPVPDVVPSEDPISDIVAAKRLRVEVTFQSAGTVFLDFDVSGANQALDALACP